MAAEGPKPKEPGRFRRALRRIFPGGDAARAVERREQLIAKLSDEEQRRVRRLIAQQQEILRGAEENTRFDGGLMAREVEQLDDLIDSFIDAAGALSRWERYLAAADLNDLEAELRRAETDSEQAMDEEQRALARKNLGVLKQRRDQLAEMRRRVVSARAQLELIENSFKLIGDQVLVIRHPGEIQGKLDELLAGVDAVSEMTGPTDEEEPDA